MAVTCGTTIINHGACSQRTDNRHYRRYDREYHKISYAWSTLLGGLEEYSTEIVASALPIDW